MEDKHIFHRVHEDTEPYLFIAVERTAMKNKFSADTHNGRRPEGLWKIGLSPIFHNKGRLPLVLPFPWQNKRR
jgi:hypothetical protein